MKRIVLAAAIVMCLGFEKADSPAAPVIVWSNEAGRAIVPAGWTIGRSAHSPEEAGGELSADYVLFGTVFPTESKPGAEGAGLASLQEAAAACHAPVIAIGGITPERAAQARAAGAAGVAAIGGFLPPGRHPSALGVRTAVRALRTSMQPR